MKNYTHMLAVQSARVMEGNKTYSDNERIIITYGIELFLNSLLKAFTYILVGLLLHRWYEVLISMLILAGVRKFSGGVHAKTDCGCFALTGSIIMIAAFAPFVYIISINGYLDLVIILNIFYLIKAPYDTYYECAERRCEKSKAKWITLIMINIFFVVGFMLDAYWRTIILVTIIGQAITLCGGRQ